MATMTKQQAAAKDESPELKKVREALIESMKGLPSHKLNWAVEAAINNFEDKIEHNEMTILREERFRKDAKPERIDGKTSAQRAEEWNKGYEPLLKFLRALKSYLNQAEAENFADNVSTYLREKHKL